MKPSSTFLPDPLPCGWVTDRIRDRLRRVVGGDWGADPGSADELVDVVVVRVADMDGIGIALDDPTIRAVTPWSLETRRLRPDSLVLEKSGGGEKQNVGRVALVGHLDGEAICSNFMAVMDVDGTTSSSFVNYAFSALYDTDMNFPSVKQTTGIQNLDVVAYLSTHIVFPVQDEQKRIAAYLDASCRAIDAAVAAKRGQIAVLAGTFKATLQRLVTRGLGRKPVFRETGSPWLSKVPRNWSLVMLKRLCDIQSGLTLGKEYEGSLVERPYLRVANVQDGHVLLDDLSTIEVPPEVAARTTLRAGDVLMTEGGDLDKLGRGVVWQGEVADCLHQNHVFAIRCRDWKLRPQFLAYVSAAQYGRDYFEATGKKTTNLAATNSTKVGQFPIPLPPVDEQDELIAYLDDESRKVSGLRSLLEQQIDTLTAYRKSLIHECVTGQRRITDEDVNRVTAHAATFA